MRTEFVGWAGYTRCNTRSEQVLFSDYYQQPTITTSNLRRYRFLVPLAEGHTLLDGPLSVGA